VSTRMRQLVDHLVTLLLALRRGRGWIANPDLLGRLASERSATNEALGMRGIASRLRWRAADRRGSAEVHVGRREQAERLVPMLIVVPGEELVAPGHGLRHSVGEAAGEVRPALQRLEMGFGERVVVGDVGGNKGKRERLEQIFTYLKKRTSMMNYDELIADDLEISTGQIEGAGAALRPRRDAVDQGACGGDPAVAVHRHQWRLRGLRGLRPRPGATPGHRARSSGTHPATGPHRGGRLMLTSFSGRRHRVTSCRRKHATSSRDDRGSQAICTLFYPCSCLI